ncbi:mediator of RNA polymerase II transcription subunit 27-like isoform X2 [Macrosteles quadrilineatus]|nr:mediator of RNA polymerase II transcription subunit 27-like isoform X2 [Macrosteles quadrilineatus]XP_054274958.1 mediator of RNA polymerase II transcription subunit 27-like isoform X2 [Macrosteles quadrilineatus]XP_054276187.1 mediator of RNA polymerase II transcription subunit 27-like isoform X2 [Macrosteles quadrilineatus]
MENLYTALSAVKTLRSSVGQVFSSLSNGLRADHGEDGKENKFLLELQDLLSSVNNHLRDVEQAVNGLSQPPGPFSLGNTSFLSQECTHDRLALYSQLVLSYKWTDKLHEYSSLATQLLNQNSLKRSYTGANSSKRRRTPTSAHNVPIQAVETLIAAIDRQYQDMNISICREFRNSPVGPTQVTCAEVRLTQQSISRDYQAMHDNGIPQVVIVQVTLGRVLQALLTLKGMMIEWVNVKGFGETLELWSESRHKVFRKLTENTHAAMLHFYSPNVPEFGVRSFITWLHSYNNLFSEPCKRCGNYLQSSLPPTCRDLRTLEPYHEECRP